MSAKIAKQRIRKKKSSCWHFYNKSPIGGVCRLCNNAVKTSGNTTNLINHLKRKHSPQWRAALEGREEDIALKYLEKDENETIYNGEEDQASASQSTTLQAYRSEDGNTIIWLQPATEQQATEFHPQIQIVGQQTEVENAECEAILPNGEVHERSSTPENVKTSAEEETEASASKPDETPKKAPPKTPPGSVQVIQKFLQSPNVPMKPGSNAQPGTTAHDKNTEDSFDLFGKYIASLLRSLPSRKAACKLQKEMVCWALQEQIRLEDYGR